jgi:CHAT domain-containing protein
VHHSLRRAHELEWPALERIVVTGTGDRFGVLGNGPGMPEPADGEALLEYLLAAPHTMVHFACHCDPGENGEDVLEVSVLASDRDDEADLLTLDTYTFTDVARGRFLCRPLVFLNACQASGRPDPIRATFNLPRKFVLRGAGAVVATACPVPDLFAATFARRFYEVFLGPGRPLSIGEALRRTRREFLERHNNPLGLAYGLYTPAQYRLAQAPTPRSAAR